MELVVLCIGSDKISGDSLGPLVGGLLREKYRLPCPVYGTEKAPVNGVNLPEYREMLTRFHPEAAVIAVDAAVGLKSELGNIKIRNGGVKAGGAVAAPHKALGRIGVLGVVAEKGNNPLEALLATPFALVEALAERIARAVALLIYRLSGLQSTSF